MKLSTRGAVSVSTAFLALAVLSVLCFSGYADVLNPPHLPARCQFSLRLATAAGGLSARRLLDAAADVQSQLSTFTTCLKEHNSDGSVVQESGAGSSHGTARQMQVSVTMQRDPAYAGLQKMNAQLRGSKLLPIAFVEPTSTAEVAAVVHCCVRAGLEFVVRSGGHSYEANSLLDDGIVIDLNKLRDISIDTAAGTVTVGAGQKLGPVYAALLPTGYTLGGVCAGVGVSGHTLGGGIGHATRALGVLADSVLEATVVLPAWKGGQTATASAAAYKDLFWATRGGGPFYGVVTSWRLKLHKAPEKVAVAKYQFRQKCTAASFASVLKAWNEWQPWKLDKQRALVDVQCGFNQLRAQVYYWGSMNDLVQSLKQSPVYQLDGAEPVLTKEYNFADYMVNVVTNLQESKAWSINDLKYSSVAQDQGSWVAGSMLAMSAMNTAAVEAVAKHMEEAQEHAFIQVMAFGGAMSEVAADFDAFPWHNALFEMQVYSKSGDKSKDREWVDRTLSTVQPLLGSEAEYYNYFHCVKDPWKTYFGPHADRLQKIRETYDPQNRMGGLYCQQGVM